MGEFDKIIGYEREKNELVCICDMLRNKEKYERFGVSVPKTLLLYGEPGLGKTMMAKALIAESGRKVFACKKDRSDGEFVAALKSTFENASEHQPSIVFLDDMDKFAEDNLNRDCNKEEFVTIQSCLEDCHEKDVFVLATANNIDYLPESLLRAGRFGRQLHIYPPKYEDSVLIIRHYLQGKRIDDSVTAELVADLLGGSSCVELEEVINEAGMYAGYECSEKITVEHIIKAVLSVMYHIYHTESTNARKAEIVACHEAGHAVMALAFKEKVTLLTILDASDDLVGFCKSRLKSNQEEYPSLQVIQAAAAEGMGGKAAVELIYGIKDGGAFSDLVKVAEKLRHAAEDVAMFGFEYGYDSDDYTKKQAYTRLDKITDRIYTAMEEAYETAKRTIEKNRELLEAISAELIKKRILVYEDILKIAEQHPCIPA